MGADHAVALLAAAAALVLWSPSADERRRRAHRVAGRCGRAGVGPPAVRRRASASRPSTGTVVRRRAAAAGAGLGVALLVGGPVGAMAGLAVGGAAGWLLRRGRESPGARLTGLEELLPVGCDLLAVCVTAGLPLGTALAAVAAAVPDPLGEQLRRVAALYRLGADPGRAWTEAAVELQPVGRILVRGAESGAAVGPALRALAAELRAHSRSSAQARVQRAGVWVLAPLGACFLPAFLCLGVLPMVLGIAGEVFG